VRRATLIALSCVAALLLAGCGAQGVVSPAPATVEGTLPKPTLEPITPAFKLKGDPDQGKSVFAKSGCGSCHTLVEAKSTGTVGPNLDQAHPDYRLATARVTNGKGVMPSFKGTLSDQEIANVAAFVVKSTSQPAGQTQP
jgi:mono/diheme cytochrome c family protein